MGQALRLATEMVAGVAVGGFIGWALDRLFGTAPFGMVVFLFLGGAAGIMNVVRTAKSMQGEPLPGEHLRNAANAVSYTHLRAHETRHDLVCRLLLEKK